MWLEAAENKKARSCLYETSGSTGGTSGFFKTGNETNIKIRQKNLTVTHSY
jgi:hypothetical protein